MSEKKNRKNRSGGIEREEEELFVNNEK